ncbi:thioredoxin family protein [Pedobacter sp. BAL39]|uniref:TlpA disulfide reductase family protein n=1 Tax=Pedobacter sp. BAL39 TaxID=391596 RepID=UPI000155AC87|nr:TlpA disulfide reductase family protein [Pedobacter sp. BAL39]EDM33867.1 thioredoxin family protein [Pedobacter sp. BAL39]
MRKVFGILILGLLSLNTYSQYPFTINLKTKTLSGRMVYFNIMNNDDFIPVRRDSARIENGQYKLTGEMNQMSSIVEFSIKGNGRYNQIRFVVDSGQNNLNVELVDEQYRMLRLTSDAKGCQIYDEMIDIFDSKANSHRVDGRYQLPAGLTTEILWDQLRALKKYPDDYGSLLYLYAIGRTDYSVNIAKGILETFDLYRPALKNSALGKKLYQDKADLISSTLGAKIGAPVRIFNVNDIDDKPFTNASLEGQNYLIVFSATWCLPCQLQLPKLKEIYQDYRDKGLKVIYFNNDADVQRWKKHVATNNLTWVNVSERMKPAVSKIQKSFGVFAIPTCLLVNKDGMIVYNSDQMDAGLDQLDAYVKKVFLQ